MQFYPTELPVDSVVMASVHFYFYNFQELMETGNMAFQAKMGKDIIVIWMPKQRSVDEIEAGPQGKTPSHQGQA